MITITNKNSKRDFLHIDDFIEVILKIKDIDFKFEVFNVGSGISFSFEKIIKIIETRVPNHFVRIYIVFHIPQCNP